MRYDRPAMKVKRARAARRRPAAGDDDVSRAPAEPEAAEVEEPEPEAPVEAELVEVEPAGDGVIDVEPDAAAPKERQEPGLVRRDPLGAYMAEIRRIPLLSREEETELAKKYYATGDVAIAKRLITANLRLEGKIGLMQAMRKYDPYRGVKLSSYAAWWIRAYILKFILNNWRLVKIGTTQAQRKLFFNLRKEKEKLEQLGFQASSKALAEALNVPEREVIDMEKRLGQGEMSLDAPLGKDDDGGRSHMDMLESSGE